MKNKAQNKKRISWLHTQTGFTLVESLVAISILLIGVTAPISIAYQSIKTANSAQDKVSAYYFAQEGIEYIRHIRDTNIVRGDPWNTHMGNCDDGDGCIIDDILEVVPNGGGVNMGVDCNGSCPVIEYDVDDSLFGEISGGPIEDTKFTRRIDISSVSAREIVVSVTVSWSNRGGADSYTLAEHLYDWSGI